MLHLKDQLCDSCGKPKAMYYGAWCPRCEKTKCAKDKLQVFNLIMCLDHLESINKLSTEDRELFWNYLCDTDDIKGNDTVFYWSYHDLSNEPNSIQYKCYELFKEHFGIDKTVLMEVSW